MALDRFMKAVSNGVRDDAGISGEWLMKHPWWWYLQTLHLELVASDEAVQRKTLKLRRSMGLREEKRLGRWPAVADVRADFPDVEMEPALLALLERDLELVKQPIRRRSRDEGFAERIEKLTRRYAPSGKGVKKKAARRKPKLTDLQDRVDKMIKDIENPPMLREIDRNVDRLLGLAGKKKR